MSELKYEPWAHHELVAHQESIIAVMGGTFDRSVDEIKQIEISLLYMMQSSKEYVKANKQFKEEPMRENVLIQIDTKMFDAEVGYEILDGVITDINTLFIVVDGIQWNMHYLIESLKEGLAEDITNNLKGRIE